MSSFAAGLKKKKESKMEENEVQSFKKERDGVGKAYPLPRRRGKMAFVGGRVRLYVG